MQLAEKLGNCTEDTANAQHMAEADAQQALLKVCMWLLGSAPEPCTSKIKVGGLPLPSTLPNGINDASHSLVTALLAELNSYLPSANNYGSSERTLTKALLRLTSDPEAAASHCVGAAPVHPLRAVSLARGLDTRIWDASNSNDAKRNRTSGVGSAASPAKGNGVFAFTADSFYSLSHDASSVSWFVSHAWPDDCLQKLKHLRFLAVVNLLGTLFVACPLLALYFMPLGISLEGVQGVRWWVAPLLPLTILASACLWVALSYAGLMPSIRRGQGLRRPSGLVRCAKGTLGCAARRRQTATQPAHNASADCADATACCRQVLRRSGEHPRLSRRRAA
jgi:hypothetical protein